MADNKKLTDGRDDSKVDRKDPSEVRHLADQFIKRNKVTGTLTIAIARKWVIDKLAVTNDVARTALEAKLDKLWKAEGR